MKVLHITTSDSGGAGMCVMRIHKSLLDLGVDSRVLVSCKSTDDSRVIKALDSGLNKYIPPKNSYIRKLQKVMRRRGRYLTQLEKYERSVKCLQGKAFFTFPLSGYDLSKHPLVEEADIIHLHWVANFLDYPTFFRNVNKPIVWTLHDENIAFGGFHYERERDKYYDLCKKTEDELQKIKLESLAYARGKVTFIALSEMMKSFCEKIPVVSSFPIIMIHNGVDYKRFVQINHNIAKNILDIPDNHLVFGFCSVDLGDTRKGLKELVLTLERLRKTNTDKITLLCAGKGDIPIQTNVNVVKMGPIHNERIMSLFYSASDYFMLPSFEEAFAQTPLEAMACGVPVIGFPCGVINELINEANGVRCEDFTMEALFDGIMIAMSRHYDCDAIRKDVIDRFSYNRIGRQYLGLYKKVLGIV